MNKYAFYIFSPLFYICVALAGRIFTSKGIDPWYQTLSKPSYTPPGSFIGIMWTVIYILTACSLILFSRAAGDKKIFWPVVGLYIINGIVNTAWSYIFFTKHLLGLAVINAGIIGVTVVFLIVLVRHYSVAASLLLIPYLGWVSFATFLTYVIYKNN
jgi:tryptophan-rich sensory protein